MADDPTEHEMTSQDAAHDSARASDERHQGATPPGYDWPTHGGYLGCLLGVMAACLLAPLGYILFGFLGAFLTRPLGGFGFALAIILTVGVYLAAFVALSRLGWAMGKRFLREYEQPARPVWDEDDEDDEDDDEDEDDEDTLDEDAATDEASDQTDAAPPSTVSAPQTERAD